MSEEIKESNKEPIKSKTKKLISESKVGDSVLWIVGKEVLILKIIDIDEHLIITDGSRVFRRLTGIAHYSRELNYIIPMNDLALKIVRYHKSLVSSLDISNKNLNNITKKS
jgi:hypothetical protein